MESTCPFCKRPYIWRQKTASGRVINEDTPKSCGRRMCAAAAEWTDGEWAGRARMARARREAGEFLHRSIDEHGVRTIEKVTADPLDDLDREALRRFPDDAA